MFFRRYILLFLAFCLLHFECSAFAIKDPFVEKIEEGIEQIEIQYIYSDGKITTVPDSKTTSFKVYGRQEALDALLFYRDGSQLKLKYNDKVNSDNNLKVYVEISMPQQTDLDISVIDGEWSIDDLIGDVKLKSYGDGAFSFHKLDSEEVEITLNGSGNIDIKGGLIEDFKIKILGNGAISFGGIAEELEYEIIGSGQLKIHQVLKKISNRTIFGSGKVKIKNPPAEFRNIKRKNKTLDLKGEELDSTAVQGGNIK